VNSYVLDTDTLTLSQRGQAAVQRNAASHPPSQVAVSVISVQEQLSGWYTRVRRAKRPDDLAAVYERLAEAIRFLRQLTILGFPPSAVQRYESLRKLHRSIGKNDLRIAAIALDQGSILVTRNRADFGQIAGLALEDGSG